MIRALRTAALFALAMSSVGVSATPESELAERLLQAAGAFAQSPQLVSAAEATSEAAMKIVGDDPRLLRQAIDLQFQLGNREKALELLNAYRKLQPEDQLSQVQTIDLLTAGMQSADAKRKYLSQIAASDMVPKEVRSHVSTQLFVLLSEQGDDAEALRQLNQALLLNPVNAKALQVMVERLFTNPSTAPQRAQAIVNLLKSNPMQPASIATLAEELARVGASEEAIAMYRKSLEMNNALSVTPGVDDVINVTALLLATGKPQETPGLAAGATQLAPGSGRAWFMRLLVEKQVGTEQTLAPVLNDARTALTRNLMVLHRQIDPKAPEVTEQTPAALPDVASDATAAKTAGEFASVYAAALSDLAWLDAYFGNKSPDPAVMTALATLLGENNVVTTRLQGFAALSSGRDDEAGVKLAAIAERDSLARVGMLALRLKKGESKDALSAEASTLLAQMPIDVWSATLRNTLKDLAPITFATADKDAVIAESAKLPDAWLQFPKNANTFYLAELRAVRIGLQLGEPMLMTLRIQNISQYPLVIGPGGVIDQTVVIDAQARGPVEQYFPGVAMAKLTGVLVLQPRQSIVTPIRVDNTDLTNFLNAAPHVSLTVYASAVTNARVVQGQNGSGIIPGPGGFREQAESVLDRAASPLAKDTIREQLAANLGNADAMVRLVAYRSVAANVQALLNVPQATDQHKQLAEVGVKMIDTALSRETDASIKAHVLQLQLGFTRDPETLLGSIKSMLAAPEWQSRIIGTLVAVSVPQAKRQELLKPLANDPDESIKKLAAAVITIPDPQPATQPGNP